LNSITRTFGFIHRHPLARKHLFRVYFRFISWQVQLLFSNKLIALHFVGSTKIFAKRGLTGITGNIYTGLQDFEEMSFLLHLLRETDTFFDVGANVGSYSILASGVCNSKSLSIEPVLRTFEILKNNIGLNHLQHKIKPINAAAGNEQTSIKFTYDQDATNHVISAYESDYDYITVPVVKLDQYSSENPVLLKIDVEGFESQVVLGAEKLLNQKSLKAIIIELNGSGGRYGFNEELIHLKLTAHGFRPYNYDPFKRELRKLDHYGNFNTIYLRDLCFINERLKSANAFKIFSRII
jgi:FkbM family methyltransferase